MLGAESASGGTWPTRLRLLEERCLLSVDLGGLVPLTPIGGLCSRVK